MVRLSRRVASGLLVGLTLLVALPLVALAHESRDVAGKYRFVVGWSGEPAYVGQKNGISLVVTNTATNQPVEGLEKTLKAEIVQGAQKGEVPLRAVFRSPGAYTADIIPTREGDYRFRFSGTIEGTAVDETFDSADGKFDGVKGTQAILFPAGDAAAPSPALVAAEQKAAQAQMLGVAGLVAGLAGLVLGGLAFTQARRTPTAAGARVGGK